MLQEKYNRRVLALNDATPSSVLGGIDTSPIYTTKSLLKAIITDQRFWDEVRKLRSIKIESSMISQLQLYMDERYRLNEELLVVPNDVVEDHQSTQLYLGFSLPDYLAKSIDGATSFNITDLLYDARIGVTQFAVGIYSILGMSYISNMIESMIMNEPEGMLAKLRQVQERWYSDYKSSRDAILASPVHDKDPLLRMWEDYNKSEAKKSMLLFGVPFTYHMLMEGRHSKYPDREQVMDDRMVRDFNHTMEIVADVYIKLYGVQAQLQPSEVKLPIGTSQGILLRGTKDTPTSKAYYKFILSLYASKCKSRKDINELLDALDNEFMQRGFDKPSRSAMLGLRKMHISRKKNEPFFDHGASSTTYSTTKQTQGRVRAIFPFTEALKYWVKSYAEPIKYNLFHAEGCFAVDPTLIHKSQNAVREKLLTAPSLMDHWRSTGECVVAYDLHECDRTFHWQMNDAYVELFLKRVIKNGPIVVGEHHNDGDVIAIRGVRGHRTRPAVNAVFSDKVSGCSTLSGQADVTLKNNVIHFCLVVYTISVIHRLEPKEVVKLIEDLIVKGMCKLRNREYILHMHGDDVFLYLSDQLEDYKRFSEVLNSTGASSGFEDGLVYLKKMIVPSLTGDRLIGIPGSLLKNRLGEYPQHTPITLILSICDAMKAATQSDHSHHRALLSAVISEAEVVCQYMEITSMIFKDSVEIRDTAMDLLKHTREAINLCKSSLTSRPDSRLISESMDDIIRSVSVMLSKILMSNTPKAVQIRRDLLTDSYKLNTKSDLVDLIVDNVSEISELELDDIQSLATYSIDPSTVSNRLNLDDTVVGKLMTLDRGQLLELIVSLQSELLDSDGMLDGQIYIKTQLV